MNSARIESICIIWIFVMLPKFYYPAQLIHAINFITHTKWQLVSGVQRYFSW